MTGNPIRRTLCAVLCAALISLPLIRLTASASRQSEAPSAEAAAPAEANEVNFRIRLKFSELPKRVRLRHGDKVVAESDAVASSPWKEKATLPLPAEGLELALEVAWEAAAEVDRAVSVSLQPDEKDEQSQTIWTSDAEASEILTFRWK